MGLMSKGGLNVGETRFERWVMGTLQRRYGPFD